MTEIIDKMLSKPLATIVVTTCIAGAATRIICAVKGTSVPPLIDIRCNCDKADT